MLLHWGISWIRDLRLHLFFFKGKNKFYLFYYNAIVATMGIVVVACVLSHLIIFDESPSN